MTYDEDNIAHSQAFIPWAGRLSQTDAQLLGCRTHCVFNLLERNPLRVVPFGASQPHNEKEAFMRGCRSMSQPCCGIKGVHVGSPPPEETSCESGWGVWWPMMRQPLNELQV